MPQVFLLGRHGTGKSTIGRAMEAHGYQHVSVGALRRLAGRNEFPSDIPVSLMLALRNAPRTAPMPGNVTQHLLTYLSKLRNAIVDGFPYDVWQLRQLPHTAVLCLVWVPAAARETRLIARASASGRTWTPGGSSMRDETLPMLVKAARAEKRILFIPNRAHGSAAISEIATSLAERLAR